MTISESSLSEQWVWIHGLETSEGGFSPRPSQGEGTLGKHADALNNWQPCKKLEALSEP